MAERNAAPHRCFSLSNLSLTRFPEKREMHYSAQIQVVVWFISCLFLLTYKEMAVEAVLSEPLSRPDSLLSGINTGIFRRFCWKCPSIIRLSS